MRHSFVVSHLLLALVFIGCSASNAPLRLHALFSDHMVLQRNTSVPIWGWAEAGMKVTVSPAWGDAVQTRADDRGRWTVSIQTPDAGGPSTMTVATSDTTITIGDIVFGEVWLGSGQSNMEMPLKGWPPNDPIEGSETEIATADFPMIRMFTVERTVSLTPKDDVKGSWIVASPETVAGFSATAYFFAKDLHAGLDVPVGIIHSSWGGTPAEAWVPSADLANVPGFETMSESFATAEAGLALSPNSPSLLFNGMIAPILPYAMKGVIWYQGESNVGRGKQYETLFPTLIRSWRARWESGEFPFYFVQIAPFIYGESEPSPAAELREAQRLTLSLPNTGMVVTSDIGNPTNIHPANKKDVGERLSLWALAETYGKDIVHSGPLADRAEFNALNVVVRFKHVGSGLVAKGGPLTDFELAGADGVFHPANAVISGETVVVSSAKVSKPVTVRFGWREASQPNLFNKEGLPASSFILR